MSATPLLIIGDSPDAKTGLARIAHDLAWLASSIPELRVGVFGRGGLGRKSYPWASYDFDERYQWGETRLEEAWRDFCPNGDGIMLTCWDASRLLWLAHPSEMPEGLQAILRSPKIQKRGYFMVDSAGPDPSKLPMEQSAVMQAFDRVCVASKWAHGLTKASIPAHPDLDWLPHPLNRNTFRPMDRELGRSIWGVKPHEKLVGVVMTNQARKHWPTVMETLALMPDVKMWFHTDRMQGYWNIGALGIEYGVTDRLLTDARALADKELAMRYSACDATLVISGGEGHCYPVAESLSCGVPAVTGAYGAQAELTFDDLLVPPSWSYIDTNHNVRRAMYDARLVADRLYKAIALNRHGAAQDACIERVKHLDFKNLALVWQKWLRKGLEA